MMQFSYQEALKTKFKFKIRKFIKWFGTIVGLLFLLVIIYLFTGFGKPDTKIDYIVKVDASTYLLEVNMTIEPNKFLFLDLFLNSIRGNQDIRLKDLEVKRNNKKIAHWRTIPSLSSLERIWVGFSKQPITITYTIDPFVERGDRGKALSFLSNDYGYFRGTYILYTPISFKEGKAWFLKDAIPKSKPGIGSVQFNLPEGWQINDPWENKKDISISELRNTYWGLGDDANLIRLKDISIGMIEDLDMAQQKTISQNIEKIYNEIEALTHINPKKPSSSWAINILPPVPIHGGAASDYSLLTENDIATICHEMFHWWNGYSIDTSNNANWLKEGFTEYYAGKILLDTGIWSKGKFDLHTDKLITELYSDDDQKPVNLIEASMRLTNNSTSMEDYYQVYNGGALLAYYIDRELKKDNKSLDQIWTMLYELDKVITNDDFVNSLRKLSDASFADQILQMIEGKRVIPLKY